MKKPTGLKTQIIAVLFIVLSASACVVRPVAQRPLPPPVRVEVIPRQPSPRYHWAPGYYRWRRGSYVWVGGRYRR